jgi:hypothetical protein
MRNLIRGMVGVIMLSYGLAWADGWDSGHHDIYDGETYGEIWLHNDATADMWGGNVFQLGALDTSRFNMYDGTMNMLLVRYNSTVNIYGGTLNALNIYPNESGYVNLYADDVIFHSTGGHYDRGWIEGKYISNNQYFDFDIVGLGDSHINVVPEPMTFLLLGLGGIALKQKKR